MFHYRKIEPPPDLAEYVRFFWVLESSKPSSDFYIHRAMADGCAEMLFHYKGRFDEILSNGRTDSSFWSGFHGQTAQVRRFRINTSFGIFGVYLFPSAIPALFGIPASEVSNQMPELHDVLGPDGKALEEKVMLADTNEMRVNLVTSFLRTRLLRSRGDLHPLHKAVKHVIAHKGRTTIGELADRHFLGERQFERKFKELSGFSPKLYSRIVRFQSVFPELATTASSLTQVALNCGYYDQSHFVHDFKKFSGFSPNQFLKENSTEATNWAV